jgi:hypothetical protein
MFGPAYVLMFTLICEIRRTSMRGTRTRREADRRAEIVNASSLELKSRRGGVDNDYFGLLFLEKEFKLSREEACEQTAYGGNDFGIEDRSLAGASAGGG